MARLTGSLRRFSHNLAAGTLGQIINVCAQVISVPLFLSFWSKSRYGEWLVLTSIPSLLWCFEGGLAGVASSRMTVAAAGDNWTLANALFQNVFALQSILCVLIMATCLAFVHSTAVAPFFHLTTITNRDASGVLLLMICYMIFGFFINLLRAAYRASEIEARGLMVVNGWRMIDLTVTILVLIFHGGVFALATGLAGSAGFCLLITWADVYRTCPRIRFGLREVSWHQSRALMIDGAPLLISMAANAFSLQGYPLLVNRFLGAGAVVDLSVIRAVSRIALQGIQLLTGSSAPELSRTYGRKDSEGYLRLLKIVVAASFWGGLVSCMGMPIFGPWVIKLWTSGRVDMDSLTLFLFAITIVLQGAWGVCATVLVASNMHHLFNYLYFSFTVVALLVVPYFMIHGGFRSIPIVILTADSSLLLAGIFLCRQKLTHISFGDLACVFHPLFYLRKAAELRRSHPRAVHETTASPLLK
jgi:O-antigen/teichoic acid export membrane protein